MDTVLMIIAIVIGLPCILGLALAVGGSVRSLLNHDGEQTKEDFVPSILLGILILGILMKIFGQI